jgi:hypothetical protein
MAEGEELGSNILHVAKRNPAYGGRGKTGVPTFSRQPTKFDLSAKVAMPLSKMQRTFE